MKDDNNTERAQGHAVATSSQRLECLKLAIEAGITGSAPKVVEAAKVFADFIYVRGRP